MSTDTISSKRRLLGGAHVSHLPENRWLCACITAKRSRRAKQIVFEGERFDVMSVRRWRERVLRQ